MTGNESATSGPRRLVIFVGPHKSASSTVQEFLVQYATGRPRYRKLKAFQGWRWPVVTDSRVPARKQWARLVYTHQSNLDETHRALKTTLQETLKTYSKVAVGSEEFDRFGSTPWSHRDGTGAVNRLIEWAQDIDPSKALQVDIVVNYRTPRQSQWISIWKQLMSLEETFHKRESITYPQWICQEGNGTTASFDVKVWEYLDCVANPLGLTAALLQSLSEKKRVHVDWKVTLIDMGGVARQRLDIAHTSACHIMGLPCTQGWVRGINRTLVINPKSRPLEGVSTPQLNELEWLLQQRDCTYRQLLNDNKKQNRLTILYPDALSWENCLERENVMGRNFQNTTYLLQAMQSQFGCQPSTEDAFNLTRMVEEHWKATHTRTSHRDDATLSTQEAGQDWLWIYLLQWAIVALLFAGLQQIKKQRHRNRCLGGTVGKG